MSYFNQAFASLMKHEGNYSNVAEDLGGETYKGIARKYWPNWEGWPLVDAYRRAKGGTLRWNTYIPNAELDLMVKRFVEVHYWKKYYLDQVSNADLASLILDTIFNHGSARYVQKAANALGASLQEDGILGPKTLAVINALNPSSLYNQIKKEREKHYLNRIKENVSQVKFYDGWMARINSFDAYEKKNC